LSYSNYCNEQDLGILSEVYSINIFTIPII
jgi:hypothetical protein